MPGLPYPGWNVVYGATPTAAYWSEIGANTDALAAGTGFNTNTIPASALIGINLFGVGPAQYGTAPVAHTGQFYFQGGSNVVVTNSAGNGNIAFGATFPNGTLTVIITEGDITTTSSFQVQNSTVTSSGFSFLCSSANNTVRVNWVALGF